MNGPRPALSCPVLPHVALIAAGAVATGVIGFGVILAQRPNPGAQATFAVLFAVYVAGLGLGRLLFKRGNSA
jgi:hypothetical protein